jgi:hypothetical protein
MPRRTRSLLIDASLGKIFAGASDSLSATAANLIGGSTLKSIQRNFGTSGILAKVTNDVITRTPFPANAIITAVKVMVNTAPGSYQPTGSSIIITLKTGLTYATSTSVGDVSLPALTTSATTATSISILAGYTLYWDIIQVGSIRPGIGLSITPYYYIGH